MPMMRLRAPTPTPTPMPTSAPLVKPPPLLLSVAEVFVAVAGAVEDATEVVEAGSATVVVGVVEVEDVAEAVTKILESEDCSSILIGCAHIVIGPVTCVLMSLCRTVTIVELDDGNML